MNSANWDFFDASKIVIMISETKRLARSALILSALNLGMLAVILVKVW